MRILNGFMDALVRVVMACSVATVFFVTFAQVLARYVFKSPLPWSTDILRLAFVYLVFWGAAWCVKEMQHLNVDVVLAALPGRVRHALEILISLVMLALFVFLVFYGYKFALGGLNQTAPYLGTPMAVYYAAIPSSALVMIFYLVQILAEQISGWSKGTARTQTRSMPKEAEENLL